MSKFISSCTSQLDEKTEIKSIDELIKQAKETVVYIYNNSNNEAEINTDNVKILFQHEDEKSYSIKVLVTSNTKIHYTFDYDIINKIRVMKVFSR